MRVARKKMLGRSCYYHCCARIAGLKGENLFTDLDKEKGMRVVVDLCRLFFIEPIVMTWMGNHWHIIVYAPDKKPSLKETEERYNSYYDKKHHKLSVKYNPEECERVAGQLIDISFFMRQIHQKFTYFINKVHDRRGTLWAERFKSTILEDKTALWNCVEYVELNPVRGGLVKNPADYRFCSWGNYCSTGKHIFGNNFVFHMRKYLGEVAKDWTDNEVYAEFRSQLAATIARESGATSEEIINIAEQARKKESMPFRFLRRTRHWTDGAIIGSKSFVQEVGILFDEKERVLKKQFSSGITSDGIVIHCFKRLRLNLP